MSHKTLWITSILLSIIVVTALILKELGYSIVYQGSTSMPKGFYWVSPVKQLNKGDIVVFNPPEATEKFLWKRHWLPEGASMMKHVEAVPGDMVCKSKGAIWINEKRFAQVYRFYTLGKRLPGLSFCEKLGMDEYLLMSTDIARSFDGRYFGPVKKSDIKGRAGLLFKVDYNEQ
ncbi:MAG: signal peptidase I [Gammaproteobacteria bacterium RIFCSPHIGHO2_02_FULL_42_13]|nr:MAG: signal peptidase I [Gammaproteobacteria bacterium RIFCSPHIGHO2_02_FULL_42_13]OGT70042.1 MAG: signal peptidase I [Gammaproteobacteria bacterium RIFCSPLOWO2_02_FULL_42_9]